MTSRARRYVLVVLLSLVAQLVVTLPRAAAADPQPDAVSVPGTFGSDVGCTADWQPDCVQLQLSRRADDVWSVALVLPAGSYEYKAAIDKSFDVNYGLHAEPGGANIPVVVPPGGATVTFYYDSATHWVTADVTAPVVTAAGSFQSELGCAADWSPDCLRSWLQDVDGDGVYTFTTTAIPAGDYEVKATLGLSFDVNYGAGGQPNGANIAFSVGKDNTPTTFSYDSTSHVLSVSATGGLPSLTTPTAYWLSRHYLAWDLGADPRAATYALYAAPRGGLKVTATGVTGGTAYPLTYVPSGLPATLKATFPGQAGLGALRLKGVSRAKVRSLLRGQVAVVALDGDGAPVAGAGLQIPGVLDDVYAAASSKRLGLSWKRSRPTLALWAPTATSVSVHVYTSGRSSAPVDTVPLGRSGSGVWSVRGPEWWRNRFYLYEVRVFVPETGRVETNLVTDPYSVGLSRNSVRSLMVDLNAKRLKPKGWSTLKKPRLAKPVDQAITELHLRDFSISDPTVPAADRGTYEAFTDSSSKAVGYLRGLAKAGMTTVHLLPLADMSTVNEDKSTWATPDCDLPALPPDSDQQQACVKPTLSQDGFNWGYDPLHYTTPEGSYSTKPNGSARTREFRDMVKAINGNGQRVVMDMVYNHTTDSGQTGRNDLDRIVPGYYHRLDASGKVTTSTCCANTATEHTMMGKLMIDSVLTWATEYKVDGFRFDLMGHQPKATMVELRHRLDQLTVRRDGVDGRAIYLYGEGWDFGEVAQNALFVQATQANMAGTGIGTFNDRIRDAVRGGSPFDTDPRIQGFGNGLYTDPNGDPANGTAQEQKARLLQSSDLIKVGLAGNLKDYAFTDRTGARVTGSQVDYNGQPAGYASQPQEVINYVDAHDNETLFDGLTYKLPVSTSMPDRIRMQTVALSTTAFSQGVSFWQTGSDALRSKSFEPNSYDSGDWFNVWDPSLTTNGFGRGLPVSSDAKWSFAQPLLANAALKPSPADLATAEAQSQTLLEIRKARPLLRLGSAKLIKQKLTFPNGGPDQTPGVIVMRIDDTAGRNVDPSSTGMVVVFNAGDTATDQTVAGTAGRHYRLDRLQANGTDAIVKTAHHDTATGTFSVPARTVAVFDAP
ncbi:pullulanase-type alpha-1,6-glucosidase [uncultured Friedmanniella sp.]|uniref:pullulanase-type alpha-1,6-glucosidase n=1 Tax=uncultured Friedmanniella sp. TaxID=335381 RepID=UPI0035CB6BC0